MSTKDYVGGSWEDIRSHVEDSIRSKEFEMFGYCSNSILGGRPIESEPYRTLEEVKQLASQRGCIVLDVQTKEGGCIVLFDDWFIDGPIMRVEADHYGYADACAWLEQFAGREELQQEVNMAELPF